MPFVFIDIPAPEKRYQGYEFDKSMFDCDGLHKNMSVHQFLDVLSRDHNMKVFLLEQARGRTSVDSRRRTIWSIVIMMRMIYPTEMSSIRHSTDLTSLHHVIKAKLTEANYYNIYASLEEYLSQLYTNPVLANGTVIDMSRAHSTEFTGFKSHIEHAAWFMAKSLYDKNAVLTRLSEVYRLRIVTIEAVKKKNTAAREEKLKDPSYVRYSDFIALLMLVEKKRQEAEDALLDHDLLTQEEIDALMRDIIVYNCIVVQSMIGSRLIEVLRVSTYFDVPNRAGYIRVVGVAKTRRRPIEDDDGEEIDLTITITKPMVLNNVKGLPYTVGVLLERVARVRELVAELHWSPLTNKQLSGRIVGRMKTLLRDHWDSDSLREVDGGISHTFRKLSTDLSQKMYADHQNENSWYMMYLGHTNLYTSLSYMDVRLSDVSVISIAREKALQDMNARMAAMEDVMNIRMTRLEASVSRKRRRDDDDSEEDKSDDEPDDKPDDEPVIVERVEPDGRDDLERGEPDERDELDEKHYEPEVRFDDEDDAMIAGRLLADDVMADGYVSPDELPEFHEDMVMVPRTGGGDFLVPKNKVGDRRFKRGEERQKEEYEDNFIRTLRAGVWREIDIPRIKYDKFVYMGMSQRLWFRFRHIDD